MGGQQRPIIAQAVEALIDRGQLMTANSKESKFVSFKDLHDAQQH